MSSQLRFQEIDGFIRPTYSGTTVLEMNVALLQAVGVYYCPWRTQFISTEYGVQIGNTWHGASVRAVQRLAVRSKIARVERLDRGSKPALLVGCRQSCTDTRTVLS